MNIIFEFIAYGGPSFTNEKGEEVDFKSIEDNLYKLNGRTGKIIYGGYERTNEHGFCGGYDFYYFVYKDDLKIEKLDSKVILEYQC